MEMLSKFAWETRYFLFLAWEVFFMYMYSSKRHENAPIHTPFYVFEIHRIWLHFSVKKKPYGRQGTSIHISKESCNVAFCYTLFMYFISKSDDLPLSFLARRKKHGWSYVRRSLRSALSWETMCIIDPDGSGMKNSQSTSKQVASYCTPNRWTLCLILSRSPRKWKVSALK